MPKITSMEDGLARLQRLCPGISLSSSDIDAIIDGKLNDVIKRYREADAPVEKVEPIIEKVEEETAFDDYDFDD